MLGDTLNESTWKNSSKNTSCSFSSCWNKYMLRFICICPIAAAICPGSGDQDQPQGQYIKLFGSQPRRSSPAGAGLPFLLASSSRPSNRLEHAFAACFVPRKLQLSFVNFNEATRRICLPRSTNKKKKKEGDFCTDSSKSKAMLRGAAAPIRLARDCSFWSWAAPGSAFFSILIKHPLDSAIGSATWNSSRKKYKLESRRKYLYGRWLSIKRGDYHIKIVLKCAVWQGQFFMGS